MMLVRPATLADAEALAPKMRAEDAAEALASHSLTSLDAIRLSLDRSDVAYALELDGELAAVFGVEPGPTASVLSGPEFSFVWALTGTAVERHRKSFARASVAMLRTLLVEHPVLINFIDARYTRALAWARWLGAEVQPAITFGAAQLPFHPVIFRRP